MPLTLPATVPHKRLYVVCSSVSVHFQLLQAQLNALLRLLPAKSPPCCQHPWDSTSTLAQSALSLGSHRLLSVLPIHFSSLCGHKTGGAAVSLICRVLLQCVCDISPIPEGEAFVFLLLYGGQVQTNISGNLMNVFLCRHLLIWTCQVFYFQCVSCLQTDTHTLYSYPES